MHRLIHYFFNFLKVGIGSLGIITEITIKVIPCHYLMEHTFVLSRDDAIKQKDQLLKKHKHMRYMWIPYEDCVVVVTNDPVPIPDNTFHDDDIALSTNNNTTITKEHKYAPFIKLLKQLYPSNKEYNELNIESMGFGNLRDAVLHTPSIPNSQLDITNIKQCNKAEASFWKNNQGFVLKPSDQLLQFDCGGQQWVYEVCFNTGAYHDNNDNDVTFMKRLLEVIESNDIPAPAPIEQRWSSASTSYMSPAYSSNKNDLFTWVGIIMYLPIDNSSHDDDDGADKEENDVQKRRNLITKTFRETYCKIMNDFGYNSPYYITSHWAKIEVPNTEKELKQLKNVMKLKYPVKEYNSVKDVLDPYSLLSNDVISALFDDDIDDNGKVIDDIINEIDSDIESDVTSSSCSTSEINAETKNDEN